ncbi:hypothetical protein KSP39_PZI022202 [Platanthera zijinensis]|uniref:Uncharacterized protein n=1 Tax=Platanthera zijinensis TaxID=2320716 RepID=A0AAP0AUR8_9ASPA
MATSSSVRMAMSYARPARLNTGRAAPTASRLTSAAASPSRLSSTGYACRAPSPRLAARSSSPVRRSTRTSCIARTPLWPASYPAATGPALKIAFPIIYALTMVTYAALRASSTTKNSQSR